MGVEGRVLFPDKEFLDIAMRINPEAKMCPGSTIEKKIVREAFADLLPDEVAWRQEEQFSDGVSTAEALAWDESFRNMNEPSGRAVADVHECS